MTVVHSKETLDRRQMAAHGIEKIDVKAVNSKQSRAVYAARTKVYPRRGRGTFRNLKWAVMIVTLTVYYLLPWMRWDRGPDLPDQAILLDFPHSRFFFFFLEIWPQEFYYVTGLLVLAALALFMSTAIAGRVWCGYTCPQTVWTDLMIAVERFWQGDRNARMRLDKAPWTASKIFKKTMTHASWLLVALLTGGVFVLYFRDAPTLVHELFTGTAPAIAYIFIAIFTLTTYLLGGIAREQVCTYMCPWPRIQGAMFDADSLLVTYRDFRGEPRGHHRKGESWDDRGDCVDCKACVAVCPVGIDIRDGAQLECIQCALCIDACNAIMTKIGRPKNLIAYDTFRSIESEKKGGPLRLNLLRPRVILYVVLMALVGGLMLWTLLHRSVLEVDVLRDRNPLYVQLSSGGVRNGYTLKILNKLYNTRKYQILVKGLTKARMKIVGYKGDGSKVKIDVVPDDLRELRIYVSVDAKGLASIHQEAQPFDFVVKDLSDGSEARRATTFRRPKP